jgi:hypothetical protein
MDPQEFTTPTLPLATYIFIHKKAKLLRVEYDHVRRRSVFVFDCAPELGDEITMEYQSSSECKMFGVRDSLLDRAVRVMREAEGSNAPHK